MFKTCAPPYDDRSDRVLSVLSFNEPPCQYTKGQLTTASDEDIVNSPFFCHVMDSLSVSDFNSFGLTYANLSMRLKCIADIPYTQFYTRF